MEAGNHSPEVVGGTLIADPAYMTPMWEVGLFEYEDFVTAVGDRILTFAELQRKHGGRKLNSKHRWSLRRIASKLGCNPDGRLPTANRRQCRAAGLDSLLGRFEVGCVWERDARDRAREEDDDGAWGEPDWGEDTQHEERGDRRARGSRKRDRNKRRKLAAEQRAASNPDARYAPPRGSEQWSYRVIDAVREERVHTAEGYCTQRQWRVRWEGTDDEGKPWEPTWEPLEVFDSQAEHPEDTLRQFLRGEVVALKNKLPVRPLRSADPNTWPQGTDEDMGQTRGGRRAPTGGHQGHHLR